MDFHVGTLASFDRDTMVELARYRHRVFVEKLGWDLICEDQMEFDQFDRNDTVYLIARSDEGDIVGTGRLLPTTSPYLLGDVFPQLMGDHDIPCNEKIWELSRFAAVSFSKSGTSPLGQFSSPVTKELLRNTLAVAAQNSVERLITVSPLGIERLIRCMGYTARRAAQPVVVNGQTIFACWIEVPKELKTSKPVYFSFANKKQISTVSVVESP